MTFLVSFPWLYHFSLPQSPRRFLSFSVPLSKHSYCILTFFSMCSPQLLVLNKDSLSPKAAPFSQQLCQVVSFLSYPLHEEALCPCYFSLLLLDRFLCPFWKFSAPLRLRPSDYITSEFFSVPITPSHPPKNLDPGSQSVSQSQTCRHQGWF